MKSLGLSFVVVALLTAPAWSQSTATNPTGHVGSGQRSGGPAHENIPPNPVVAPSTPAPCPHVGSGQRAGGPAHENIPANTNVRPTNPPSPHIGSGQRAGGPAHESAPANRPQ